MLDDNHDKHTQTHALTHTHTHTRKSRSSVHGEDSKLFAVVLLSEDELIDSADKINSLCRPWHRVVIVVISRRDGGRLTCPSAPG